MNVQAFGPGPVTDSAPLTPARRRVLRAVADEAGTLGVLAGRLGGHPNTTRQHLESLLAAGLVASTPVPLDGPGRRPRRYEATPAGLRALEGDAARTDYVELVGVLARSLVHDGETGRAFEIGRRWGAERSRGLGPREPGQSRRAVLEILDALGFTPKETQGPEIRLTTCPLLDTARAYPEVLCEIHRGLAKGVLEEQGSDADVALAAFAEPGACLLRIPGPDVPVAAATAGMSRVTRPSG